MKPTSTARAGRSPSYPAFDLGAAIEKARLLYNAQRMHSVHLAAALDVLGYKTLHGTSQRAIAALISYGLVAEEGSGPTRKVSVTDLTRRILLMDDDNPQRVQTIQEAALRPKIYKDMAETWRGSLPPDEAIRHYLIFDKGFHEEAVGPLIRDFKITYAFAKLENRGTITPTQSDREGTNENHDTDEESGVFSPDPFINPSVAGTKNMNTRLLK